MDQGIVSSTNGRYVRLLLIFFGAVFGLFVLSLFFGSSSASADDGGDPGDGIGAQLGGGVAAPVTAEVDAIIGSNPLGEALGIAPVTSVLAPVVKLIDTTVSDVTAAVGPVAGIVDRANALVTDTIVARVAPASLTAVAVAAIGGIAGGTLDFGVTAPLLYARVMTTPVAPVVPTPQRNRAGIAALVIVLVAIALPILAFIVFAIGASIEGAEGDDLGYAILGGFFVSAAGVAIVSPLAILGVVLGIVALTRRGLRKLQAVLAVVLGALPSLAVFYLPAAIDSLF